jgi:hypothetical protein
MGPKEDDEDFHSYPGNIFTGIRPTLKRIESSFFGVKESKAYE